MSEHHPEHDFAQTAQSEVDAIMQKYDRESAFRTLTGFRGVILSVFLILYHRLCFYILFLFHETMKI